MRKMSRAAAALALAAAAVTTVGTTGAHAAAASPATSWNGCPLGAVCIFPQNVDPGQSPTPEAVFWSYGPHNLSNEVGMHWVYNFQTQDAHATFCGGYNGTSCGYSLPAFTGINADLTPVNSITLDRP